MSKQVDVYLVSATELRCVAGCRDEDIASTILKDPDLQGNIEYYDQYLAELKDDEIMDEDEPSCRQAISQIMMGEIQDSTDGTPYIMAYEILCQFFGEYVGEWSSISQATAWLASIDRHLKALSIDLATSDLVFYGPIIQLPTADEPNPGYWTDEQIGRALEACQSADIPDDHEEADALRDVASWVSQAARQPGSYLIGFLS